MSSDSRKRPMTPEAEQAVAHTAAVREFLRLWQAADDRAREVLRRGEAEPVSDETPAEGAA